MRILAGVVLAIGAVWSMSGPVDAAQSHEQRVEQVAAWYQGIIDAHPGTVVSLSAMEAEIGDPSPSPDDVERGVIDLLRARGYASMHWAGQAYTSPSADVLELLYPSWFYKRSY